MSVTWQVAKVSRGRSIRRSALLSKIGTYSILVLVVIAVLFPVYWMAVTSLKLPRDIFLYTIVVATRRHRHQL